MIERVVVISDDSFEGGGAASIALASVILLRRRGVQVTILAGDCGNSELSQLGAEVVALGGMHILEGRRASAAFRGLYSSKARAFLDRWIDTHDSPQTVYHLHNWHKILSPSIFSSLKRVAQRLFISPHDYFLVCPNGNFYHYSKEQICTFTPMSLQCVLSHCDKRNYGHKLWRVARHAVRNSLFDIHDSPATVLAVHESMTPQLERGGVGRSAIRVLRNPVTPWSDCRVVAERNREIFFVGRLELDKGIDILARVARKIGAPLRIIGDGPLRKTLQADYPEVQFLGQKSKADLSQIITHARAIVVPTRCPETFGLVSLEGLMSGIPAIVSKSAPFSEDIVRLGFGLSFDVRDESALSGQISLLMKNDAIVQDMSQRAYAGARSLAPDADEWCDSLLRLYEEKISIADPSK